MDHFFFSFLNNFLNFFFSFSFFFSFFKGLLVFYCLLLVLYCAGTALYAHWVWITVSKGAPMHEVNLHVVCILCTM